jgi:predicted DNA-binding protein with PD1-like motif
MELINLSLSELYSKRRFIMQYAQARMGRVFVLRLEDGDIVHEVIEAFAREKAIESAALIVVGGVDKESKLVVGPEKAREYPVTPIETILNNVHEVAGTGTLFPDKDGNPLLHMHMACGRRETTTTGCIRQGVKVWHIMEVILIEITGSNGKRLLDAKTGFELLRFN